MKTIYLEVRTSAS